jgi:dihydrofolate reductase
MTLSLIVAMSEGGVIGRHGALPWRLPADLRRFRELTTGRAIIMGRRTWESIGRPLPRRTSIVLSRRGDVRPAGALVARDLDEAVELARRHAAQSDEAFVIGGSDVYRQALPVVQRMYVTLVHADVPGDARFPPLDWGQWRLVERADHAADASNEFAYSFLRYERAKPRNLVPTAVE